MDIDQVSFSRMMRNSSSLVGGWCDYYTQYFWNKKRPKIQTVAAKTLCCALGWLFVVALQKCMCRSGWWTCSIPSIERLIESNRRQKVKYTVTSFSLV